MLCPWYVTEDACEHRPTEGERGADPRGVASTELAKTREARRDRDAHSLKAAPDDATHHCIGRATRRERRAERESVDTRER